MFHRLDPMSKFVWLICISILSLAYSSLLAQSILMLLVIGFGLFCVRLSGHALWRGIRLPFWFGVPYFFLQLLFLPGETLFFQLGKLSITYEALDFASAVSLRLLILVLASLLFIVSTDPRYVVLAMAQQLRIPYRVAFAVSIALRFIPIMEREAQHIQAAQRLRGQTKPQSLTDRLAWSKRFAFSVFIHAIRHVKRTAEAMDAKAFGKHPQRTYRRTLNISKAAITFTSLCIMLTVSTVVWI